MDTTVWFIRDFLYEQMTGHRCDSSLWAQGHVATPYTYGQNHAPEPCGPEIIDPIDELPYWHGETTGIASFNSFNDFSIYPNPSSDEIYIEQQHSFNENIEVQVFNDLGRTVKFYHNVNGKLTLHKKDFGTGIFIIKLRTVDGRIGRAEVVFQ
jgi:hypothetical protein